MSHFCLYFHFRQANVKATKPAFVPPRLPEVVDVLERQKGAYN